MSALDGVPDACMARTVLLVGARGFIGGHIATALEARGHRVVRGSRPAMDLARDHDAATWELRLEGVHLVINAAGVIAESSSQSFEDVHVRGPIALFEACARRGVAVIQVSALGADEGSATGFHRSKRAADEKLLGLDVPSVVLQPSLVYGEGGASARLFTMLAVLPWIPLPGNGRQRVQPVHVDDLVDAVVRLVEGPPLRRERISIVGAGGHTLRGFLDDLRASMGLGEARFLAVPISWVRLAARAGMGLVDRDTLSMLERGNTGDASRFREILGRWPRSPRNFVHPAESSIVRAMAAFQALRPVLVGSLAFVWIVTAAVSAGLYPVDQSLALLARVGLRGSWALAALYGGALLDLALGIATVVLRRRRKLWLFQAAVIAVYTGIITVALPEQWLHPYGPLTKNVPLLAMLALLYATEEK
jgi:uncharacterized protein YbjT (DUF2867 family)